MLSLQALLWTRTLPRFSFKCTVDLITSEPGLHHLLSQISPFILLNSKILFLLLLGLGLLLK